MSTTETPTVAEEIQKALAVERQRERERTESEQKKIERWKGEPGAYLRDQAKASHRAWQLRMEAMHRDSEKRIAAEAKHAPELEEIASEYAGIEKHRDDRLQQITDDAEAARDQAQAEFMAERKRVKQKDAQLQQVIGTEASSIEPGKRSWFPRRRGAK
jgi:hypothetical protein